MVSYCNRRTPCIGTLASSLLDKDTQTVLWRGMCTGILSSASPLLCLRSGPSSRQVSITKHPKPSSHGSHTDQNTPANLASSTTATVASRSSSRSRLAPATHTGTTPNISPVNGPTCRASAHAAAVLPQPTTPASEHAVKGSSLLPCTSNPAYAMAQNRQELSMSDLHAQDSSRQPFRVIHAHSSASTATHLGNTADPPPRGSAQQAAPQQLPAQIGMLSQTPPSQHPQARQHAEATQRSDGSSTADQCSSSGSYDRQGVSKDLGCANHMRPVVITNSADTAASSRTGAAAGSAAAQATAVRQPREAERQKNGQHSSNAVHSVGMHGGSTSGISNGSPTGSRATAASGCEGRAGPMGDAPSRDSGVSSKPSRARAGVVAAGRQKKSKGPSLEVS